jgi:hypothetical protein
MEKYVVEGKKNQTPKRLWSEIGFLSGLLFCIGFECRGEAGSCQKSPLLRLQCPFTGTLPDISYYEVSISSLCVFCCFAFSMARGSPFTGLNAWSISCRHIPRYLSMQGCTSLRSGSTTSRKLGRYQIRSLHINPRVIVVQVFECKRVSSTYSPDTYASRAKSKYVLRP